MLKSLFVMPFFMALIALSGLSMFRLSQAFSLSWLAVGLGVIPFMVALMRIALQQKTARTDPNFRVYTTLALFGAAWSTLMEFQQGIYLSEVILTGWISLAFQLAYIFWFSKLNPLRKNEALKIGNTFPSITLKGVDGEDVDTQTLLKKPTLFMFYRGNWCPLCMAQVREIAGLYREIEDRGIQVVLISPQAQENTEELAKKHKVSFTYLSDNEFKLAKKLNLVHQSGTPIGINLSGQYQNDTVFPTVILTNEDGKIIHIDQTDNYRVRPEPDTFLKIFEEHKVNYELEKKVEQRTAAVRDLLDNAEEGFFTFGPDYSIHREYSQACEKFFGEPIKYKDPLNLLFQKKKKEIREVTDLLFQGVGSLELLKDLLPKEININNKILQMRYQWIGGESPKIEDKVMVVLNDVTQEREMENRAQQEEELNRIIVKVAVDRDGFLQMLREVDKIYQQTVETLQSAPDRIDPNELFRFYHTIKGAVSTYGLKKVATRTHQIETMLEPFRNRELEFTIESTQEFLTETKDLKKTLEAALDELSSLISNEDRTQSERIYRISESKIDQFRQAVVNTIPEEEKQAFLNAIEDLQKQPIGPVLQRFAAAAENLAEKLQKKVEVQLEGKNIPVSYQKLESLFSTMIHLVRNSIDHGLEDPETRQMLGKSETGKLTLKAVQDSDNLKLIVADDGGGIDTERVGQIGLEKKIIDQDFLDKASDQEINELIFAPGFSTAETVTDFSGRGAGMDAVKHAVKDLGGKIRVKSELDQGTSFELSLPV